MYDVEKSFIEMSPYLKELIDTISALDDDKINMNLYYEMRYAYFYVDDLLKDCDNEEICSVLKYYNKILSDRIDGVLQEIITVDVGNKNDYSSLLALRGVDCNKRQVYGRKLEGKGIWYSLSVTTHIVILLLMLFSVIVCVGDILNAVFSFIDMLFNMSNNIDIKKLSNIIGKLLSCLILAVLSYFGLTICTNLPINACIVSDFVNKISILRRIRNFLYKASCDRCMYIIDKARLLYMLDKEYDSEEGKHFKVIRRIEKYDAGITKRYSSFVNYRQLRGRFESLDDCAKADFHRACKNLCRGLDGVYLFSELTTMKEVPRIRYVVEIDRLARFEYLYNTKYPEIEKELSYDTRR